MKVFNLLTACAIAAPLLFVSCNSDDTLTAPGSDAGAGITFTVGIAGDAGDVLSRGRGDADGENYDKGLDGENKVNNVMIVIYTRPINYSGTDGKVVKVLYATALQKDSYSTVPTDVTYFDPTPSYYPQSDVLTTVSVGSKKLSDAYYKSDIQIENESPLEVGKRYYAIALCNFGDLSSDIKDMTLREFRDKIYTGSLFDSKTPDNNNENDKTIRQYDNFRMSGINEKSFIWERKAGESLNLGEFLVQRLAARLDVTFGEPQKEFVNRGSYLEDGYLRLAVYTKDDNGDPVIERTDGNEWTDYNAEGKQWKMPEYSFYLTDLQIVNAVNTGMYLIERSSPLSPTHKDDAGNSPQPVYLDNEGWDSFTSGIRKATKYIFCPPGKAYEATYSLYKKAGYTNLCKLIKAGEFLNDNAVYYDNKKNSYVVGYLTENTCSQEHYTRLRIVGYTNAQTSGSFTKAPSRDGAYDPSTDVNLKKVVGDIPIMHNTDSKSHIMDYAVVRNTIYRLGIKVYANKNKIYFRYYYEEPGASNQKEYGVACFLENVDDNTQNNPVIND